MFLGLHSHCHFVFCFHNPLFFDWPFYKLRVFFSWQSLYLTSLSLMGSMLILTQYIVQIQICSEVSKFCFLRTSTTISSNPNRSFDVISVLVFAILLVKNPRNLGEILIPVSLPVIDIYVNDNPNDPGEIYSVQAIIPHLMVTLSYIRPLLMWSLPLGHHYFRTSNNENLQPMFK